MNAARIDGGRRLLLLLVEPNSPKIAEIQKWLADKGMVTWWARDVYQELEELSDFTVQDRPHVVMMEASPILEYLNVLRADLCDRSERDDIAVLAICDAVPEETAPFSATDLRQLEVMIDREIARPAPAGN